MTDIVFSVVIPTYNRLEQLVACLSAIAEQTYPSEGFEVIVVDDGGSVQIDSMLRAFRNRLNIQILRQINSGPATARNRGAASASGKYVVFTDDDCRPDVAWLESFYGKCQQVPIGLFGGRTINARSDNNFSEASQHLIAYLYEYFGSDGGRTPFFASNNMAVPVDVFHQIGGFDTSFPFAAGEDREFCDRWHAEELPSEYVREAIVYHEHDMNFREFARQHFTYGRGAYHFHQARRRRTGGSFTAEPTAFYGGLIRYPLTVSKSTRRWLQSGLLLFSQFANAGGFFWERLRAAMARRSG